MGLLDNLATYISDNNEEIDVGGSVKTRIKMTIGNNGYTSVKLGCAIHINDTVWDILFIITDHSDEVEVYINPNKKSLAEKLLGFSLDDYVYYSSGSRFIRVYKNIPIGEKFNLANFILDNEDGICMSKVHIIDNDYYNSRITAEKRNRIIDNLEEK